MPDIKAYKDQLIADFCEADDAGHVALARSLGEEILATGPDSSHVLIRYASTLTTLRLYEDALRALEKASAVTPAEWMHLVFTKRGHIYEEQGNHAAAEREYLEAHRLEPEEATGLIFAAANALKMGDIPRAESLARQATQCQEGCIDEAWFNLGSSLMVQKKYAEARECYLKALAIDPDYECAKKRLADVESVLDRLASA